MKRQMHLQLALSYWILQQSIQMRDKKGTAEFSFERFKITRKLVCREAKISITTIKNVACGETFESK